MVGARLRLAAVFSALLLAFSQKTIEQNAIQTLDPPSSLASVFPAESFTQSSMPGATASNDAALKERVKAEFLKLPLRFEENRGQADLQAKFIARGPGYTLFLTPTEAVLTTTPGGGKEVSENTRGPQPVPAELEHPLRAAATGAMGPDGDKAIPATALKRNVYRMKLVGANPSAKMEGRELLAHRSNYFIGNDPSKWRTNVANYGKVRYSEVYPGIDLVFYGKQGQLEYDFVVKPGADPNRIRLAFEGVDRLRTDENGDLVLVTELDTIRFAKPVVYQKPGEEIEPENRETGKTSPVFLEGRFVLVGEREAAFEVADYDRQQVLVIDPTLSYSTFLGAAAVKTLFL